MNDCKHVFHWNTVFSPVRLVKIGTSGGTPLCPSYGQTHSYTWLVGTQICVMHLLACMRPRARTCTHTHTLTHSHSHSDPGILFWERALKIRSVTGRLWTVPRCPTSWNSCSMLLSPLTVTWTCWKCQPLSRVRLLATPRTAARQAPLSMGLSRQEHWSGLPCSWIKTKASSKYPNISDKYLLKEFILFFFTIIPKK